MTARVWRKWREVKRRPVQGNSPNDRIPHGPDCNRPKRVCADSFPATLSPPPPTTRTVIGVRFFRHDGIFRPDVVVKPKHLGAVHRLPLVGARAPVQRARRKVRALPSFAMSSGRLFLNRVARQHCPSPLHRRDQTNMHFVPNLRKQDISTLQRIGHFYFALTWRTTPAQ